MKENGISERLLNGLIKENPTFVLMLGMCPTLAVTTSAENGLGMGLTTMVVLALSNMLISLLRNIIPDKVRIPAYIVIIATFVTVTELLLKAYLPSLYKSLGLYIPLIVVNCIILGRAEAYASKYKVVLSVFDGIGMGLGFTAALTVIGAIREIIGAGELFGWRIMPAAYVPNSIFVLAPGAFFVLAGLTAIQNKVKRNGEKKGRDMSKIQSGCGVDCMNCQEAGCSRRVFPMDAEEDGLLEFIDITEDENTMTDSEIVIIENEEVRNEAAEKEEIKNSINESTAAEAAAQKTNTNKVSNNKAPNDETSNNKEPNNKTPNNKALNNKISNNKISNNKAPNNETSNNKGPNNKTPNNRTSNNKEPNNKELNHKASNNKEPNNKAPNNKALNNKASVKKGPAPKGPVSAKHPTKMPAGSGLDGQEKLNINKLDINNSDINKININKMGGEQDD